MKSSIHLRHIFPAVATAALISCTAAEADAGRGERLSETEVIEQIESYCSTSWRNAKIPRTEWADCSQQVFSELLQRVPRGELSNAMANPNSDERRELNRAIWRISKRWLRAKRCAPLGTSDCPDPSTVAASCEQRDTVEQVMKVAAQRLTPRQCSILNHFCEGDSIGQISKRLGISSARVSDEKYRAIQTLRRHVGETSEV